MGLAFWGILLSWSMVMFIVQFTGFVMNWPGYQWFNPIIFMVLMWMFGTGYKMTKKGEWK